MRNTLLKSLMLAVVLLLTLMGGLVAAQQTTAPEATFEINGPIESIDGDTLIVAGQTVDISAALLDDDVRLEVGELVEVYATFAEGVFVAFLVDDADDDDVTGFIEITGVVVAIDAETLTVAGITFDTTGAIFEDADDGPLMVGDRVEVYATFTDSAWQAARVDDLDDDDDRDDNDERGRFDRDEYDYELIGLLEEIGEGFIIVSGQTIDTTNARFDDDVRVGERVEVELVRVEGVLVAIYVDDIDLRDEDGDDGDDDRGRDDEDDDDDVPPGFEVTITAQQAAAIALEVFPSERVIDVDLEIHDETGRVAWEVDLSNGVDIYVDANTGTRLEVDMPGRDDDDDDNGRDDNDRDDNRGSSGSSGGDDNDDDDDDDWDDDNDDDDDDDDDDDWDDDDDDDD